jgi:hypothetical protein
MPAYLEAVKTTLNRQAGLKMKIIKFHLPLHFASDMLRMGSMANFDTGIGESHHKTEAKKPAKTTQRRRNVFELQTATRQIENLAISMAYDYIYPPSKQTDPPDEINKCQNIEYHHDTQKLHYFNCNKKWVECCWADTSFQTNLLHWCTKVVDSGCLKPPLRFFTQHNRFGMIFRADPEFKPNEPWYDWVNVQWDSGVVPAKMMLFIHIDHHQFNKSFNIGSTSI